MRGALCVLALGVLTLILFMGTERGQDRQAWRQHAQEMDVRLLSLGDPRARVCSTASRPQTPGILVGSRYWKATSPQQGGLVTALISASGKCTGIHYFDLRQASSTPAALMALRDQIDGTPLGSHLAFMALGVVAEGDRALSELAQILEGLGSQKHPLGMPGAAWAFLTSRVAAGEWLARGELRESSGCAELWYSLPRESP